MSTPAISTRTSWSESDPRSHPGLGPGCHRILRAAVRASLFVAWLLAVSSPAGAADPPPDFLWARRAGGGQADAGRAIAVAPDGSIVVTGQFQGTSAFGPTSLTSAGEEDMFVAKYDPAGNLLWARRAGGSAFDQGLAIATDGVGNVLIAGFFQGTASFGSTNLNSSGESDAFLAKYTPDGGLLWVRKAGGNGSDEAYGLAVDGAGHAYLTGSVTGPGVFGSLSAPAVGASNNVFVARCSAEGIFQWVRRAGGDADDQGTAIALDAATNIWIAGRFAGSFTIGTTTFNGAGTSRAFDAFVAKYDQAGDFLWARQAGGTGTDSAHAIAMDATGNAYVAGQITGTASFSGTAVTGNGLDVFLAKYSAAGNLQWVRKAGGNNAVYGDGGFGLALDPAGNPCLVGYFSGTASFGTTNVTTTGFDDLFISQYDPSGSLLWLRRAGGINLDIGYALAADPAGHLYATGFFSDQATFGSTNLPASGPSPARDIFLAKLGTLRPPVLSIRPRPGAVELTWQDPVGDFVIESAPAPGGAIWTRVPDPPMVTGDSRSLLRPRSAQEEYFRLRR